MARRGVDMAKVWPQLQAAMRAELAFGRARQHLCHRARVKFSRETFESPDQSAHPRPMWRELEVAGLLQDKADGLSGAAIAARRGKSQAAVRCKLYRERKRAAREAP